MESNKRQEILTAAFETVWHNGLSPLSYDQIAQESGISRQLIRYYFADKDSLLIALCDHLALSYRQALVALAARPDVVDRVSMIIDFLFDMIDDTPKPRDDQVYDAMMALAAGSEPVRENLHGQYSLLGHVLSHEIGIKYTKISLIDAHRISYLVVSLMYGHWKMVASLGFSEEHNLICRDAIDRIFDSYLEKPGLSENVFKAWSRH